MLPHSRSRILETPLQHLNEGEQHEVPVITQSDTATRGMFSGNDIPAGTIGELRPMPQSSRPPGAPTIARLENFSGERRSEVSGGRT
jgi:hypothetical protein